MGGSWKKRELLPQFSLEFCCHSSSIHRENKEGACIKPYFLQKLLLIHTLNKAENLNTWILTKHFSDNTWDKSILYLLKKKQGEPRKAIRTSVFKAICIKAGIWIQCSSPAGLQVKWENSHLLNLHLKILWKYFKLQSKQEEELEANFLPLYFSNMNSKAARLLLK